MSIDKGERLPLCANCYDYTFANDSELAMDGDGQWGHAHYDGQVRCPGQGEDDTDDEASPLVQQDGSGVARFVVWDADIGDFVLGDPVPPGTDYYL